MYRRSYLRFLAVCTVLVGCFNPDGSPPSSASDTEGTSSTGASTDGPTSTAQTSISASVTDSNSTGTGGSSESSSSDVTGPGSETQSASSTGGCAGAGCPCETRGDARECDDGFYCDGAECLAIECGDGRVHGDEECDDTNATDGDGCDSDCTYTAVTIDVSYRSTCALIEGGRVRCWGANNLGQLGYGNTENIGDDELPHEAGDVQLPGPLAQLQSGDDFSCGQLADMNEVVCWGGNPSGQLGYGNTDNVGDDEFPSALAAVDIGADVEFVTTGGSHACVITSVGQVKCWGRGGAQLGYGSGDTQDVGDDEVPASLGNISIGAAVVELSGGIGRTCVITSGGGVKCWGASFSGELGYGNQDSIGDDEPPSSVGLLSFPEDAIQISSGLQHTCALFQGGAVRCWGLGSSGQLGQGNPDNLGDDEVATTVPPVPLPLGGIVQSISAGDNHSCALDSEGQLACWGANFTGQLGLGHTDSIGNEETARATMPVAFDMPVRQVDAGGDHTCAVLEDYRVYCWGWNAAGQLGLGHTDDIGDDELPNEAGFVPLFAPQL